MSEQLPRPAKNENAFLNLLFNIVLPIFILNKGMNYLTPVQALALALLFPIGYGLYDLAQRKKVNLFSIVGLINVSLTGGLAVSGLGGFWFAVKEAVFPLLIGVFVAGSALTKKPLIQTLVINPQAMKWELIEAKLHELGREHDFMSLLRKSTWLLAGSFFVSAILNFVLAQKIFLPIDSSIPELERATILNQQIAEMTGTSFVVIMIPSMAMLIGIMFYLFRGMSKATGLTLQEMIR
jgi:hypothetical protein